MTLLAPTYNWESALIPCSIRKPWEVFEEDLECKLEENESTDCNLLMERLAEVQRRGAQLVFNDLPPAAQHAYVEVSLMETAAFASFRKSKGDSDCMTAWDDLSLDDMVKWVPNDPRAALAADKFLAPIFSSLLMCEFCEADEELAPAIAAASCSGCGKSICMQQHGTTRNSVLLCDDCDARECPPGAATSNAENVPRRMHRTTAPEGSATANYYTEQVKMYKSRGEALKDLGSNTRCKGHCARVRKSDGSHTLLRCRLHSSEPPCTWVRMLASEHDGSTALWSPVSAGRDHISSSEPQGERGVNSLEERQRIEAAFETTAHSLPKAVWRHRRLTSEHAMGVELSDVQNVKRVFMRQRLNATKLGDLEVAAAKHRTWPVDDSAGFFPTSFVGRESDGKPKLTLLATTRSLLRRFANAKDAVVHADGGFKYNLLGWPMTILGGSNEAGEFFVAGLGLTSSMKPSHIQELAQGFRNAAERSSQQDCGRRFSMTDAEAAYRNALAQVFGTEPLMCWFHVVSACKQYIEAHGHGTVADRAALWSQIHKDLEVLHNAQNRLDFQSRCRAVLAGWRGAGVPEATTWTDKQNRSHDFVKYFEGYWLAERKEFAWGYSGQVTATTNNQAELAVKHTRRDAGGVCGNVGNTIAFMIEQVRFESGKAFDPSSQRAPTSDQWCKAVALRSLLRTPQVRADGAWFVCHGRVQGSLAMSERPDITEADAKWAVRTMHSLLAGNDVCSPDLARYTTFRVFSSNVCSCFAHSPSRCCHHRLAAQLLAGERLLPLEFDDAALSAAARGKPKKAPGRYSVPLAPDEKDCEIARLRAQLRKKANTATRRPAKAIATSPSARATAALKQNRGQQGNACDGVLKRPAGAALNCSPEASNARKPVESSECRECSASTLQGECWNSECLLAWRGKQSATAPDRCGTAQGVKSPELQLSDRRLRRKTTSLVNYTDQAERTRSQIIWGIRFFEKQDAARCGMHALNNIVECQQFTLEFMREACREVCLESGDPEGEHMTPSGDWSVDVIARALELTVPPTLKLVMRPVIAGDWGRFISMQEIRGILVNVNHKHWVAMTKIGQHAFLVDSQHWPRVISEQEFKDIITSQPASFFVVPHDSALY